MTTRDLTDPRRVRLGEDLEDNRKEPVFENLEIPERFGPVRLLVDDHKVKRYAFTVDDYHPWCFGASPFGARIGHAGVLTNDLVQLFTLRYAASRTVGLHTEEQLWFDNPVHVGEEVTLEGAYVESYERRGLGYVVMEAQASAADGRSVVRHRGVEVLRTVPGDVAGRGSAAPAEGERRVSGEFDASLPYAVSAGAGLHPGMALAPLYRVIAQDQASVFSRAGEYVRNVHSDLAIARANNMQIPIIQGQQQCCLLLTLLTGFFGARWFTDGWIRCKFINPVEVFEPMTVSGVVVEPPGDDGRASVEVWVRREDGKLSTVGWASCAVDPEAVAATTPAPAMAGPQTTAVSL